MNKINDSILISVLEFCQARLWGWDFPEASVWHTF